jgi:hypothetical protein
MTIPPFRKFCNYAIILGALLQVLLIPLPAIAVRPFVTDDANVVGKNLFNFETSVRWDKAQLQHLNLLAYGPTEKLELTVGFTDGFLFEGEVTGRLSIAGPLGQVKYLFKDVTPNGLPGMACVVGVGAPYGSNNFGNPSWSEFAYLAVTESLGQKDAVLIHANVGVTYAKPEDAWKYSALFGVGTQIRIFGGLYGLGEIFYGDAYSGDSTGAFQAGFRYFISEKVQVDATVGSGLWGDKQPNTWVGCGLRFLFGPL